MERKDFLSKVLVGGSVLFTVPVVFSSCGGDDDDDDVTDGPGNGGGNGENTIDLTDSQYADLGSVGGYVYKGNIIVIRTGQSQYTALSKVCTHQGCTVTYDPSANQLPCPCHRSLYSISGAVVNGPAPSPLKQYSVSVDGNILTIT